MATTHRPDTLARERAHELVRAWDGRPGALGPLLGRVSSVDQVGVEERVDSLKKRSIKKASKLWGHPGVGNRAGIGDVIRAQWRTAPRIADEQGRTAGDDKLAK